jgi:hypothetical protein
MAVTRERFTALAYTSAERRKESSVTKTEMSLLKRLIKKLSDARELADRLEITVGNGGEVGSIIGSLCDELELRELELRLKAEK